MSTTLNSAFLSNPQLNESYAVNSIVFSASTSIIKDVGIRNPFWHKEIYEIPLTNKVIENPNQNNQNKIIEEISNIDKQIDLPSVIDSSNDDAGKQAARLIVIRRRKMKKHKLKKLRKKMKFEWAKVS